MANHALVIGCDRYRDPALTLAGAERDARRMRQWLLDPDGGDVPRQNLQALYSPERAELVAAIDLLIRASHGDEGRLYCYFAGHGLTATADGYDEPCLLPADFTPDYRDPAVPIRDLCEQLSASWLAPQFIFVDACRGVPQDRAFRARGLSDRRPRDYDRPEPDQYVRFATAAGRAAYEAGAEGAFTAALLRGLRGEGAAKRWDPDAEQYVVRVRELSDFVRAQLLAAGTAQEPRALDRYGDPNPVLARFPEDAFDPVSLRVSITPAEAAAHTTLGALAPPDRIRHPPLSSPVTLRLPPRTYSVRAHAAGYLPRRRAWSVDLYDDSTVEVALDPDDGAAVPSWIVPRPTGVERCSPARALRLAVPPPGTVTEVQTEAGDVRFGSAALVLDRPGRYLVRTLQPAAAGPQRLFEVPTDHDMPPVPPGPPPAVPDPTVAPDPVAGLHLAADGWWADDTGQRLPPVPPGSVAALAALRSGGFRRSGVLVTVTGTHRRVTVGATDRVAPASALTPGPGGVLTGFLPCPPGPVVIALTGLYPGELRVATFTGATAPGVVLVDVAGAVSVVHGGPDDAAALARAEAAQRFAGQGRRAEAAAVLRSGPAGLPGLVLAGLLAAALGPDGAPDLRRSGRQLAAAAPGLPDTAVLAALTRRGTAPPGLTGVPIMAGAAGAALRRHDGSTHPPALLREAVARLLPDHAATAWLAPLSA